MQKIIPRLTNVTPKEVYLQRVNAAYDAIRQTRAGMTYTPVQFGAIFGQKAILDQGLVLELTTFEVK